MSKKIAGGNKNFAPPYKATIRIGNKVTSPIHSKTGSSDQINNQQSKFINLKLSNYALIPESL